MFKFDSERAIVCYPSLPSPTISERDVSLKVGTPWLLDGSHALSSWIESDVVSERQCCGGLLMLHMFFSLGHLLRTGSYHASP